MSEILRSLPSVEALVSQLRRVEGFPRALVVKEARRVVDAARRAILAGQPIPDDLAAEVSFALRKLAKPSLRRVINATGVVLHTNLGRAPLFSGWLPQGHYSNLEYDLGQGRRGKRDSHFAPLLERVLDRPALAVNNGAAAVWLVLREFAKGEEVIVSRGELIEIGDGFRIPDIMAESGARLVEVGTTNRTRIDDYRKAITGHTKMILRVHRSNFQILGFAASPALGDLASLTRELGLMLYEDLGSGSLWDLESWGVNEPTVAESLAAGVDLVSFSGDKLLGGPQAGIIAGRPDLIERLRKNPMYRALRLDKLATAALESALRSILLERWDELPALRMIRQPVTELKARAERIAKEVDGAVWAGESVIGGGSTPEQRLPTWLVALPGVAAKIERGLRLGAIPVVARIQDDHVVLDVRTVAVEEETELVEAVKAVFAS